MLLLRSETVPTPPSRVLESADSESEPDLSFDESAEFEVEDDPDYEPDGTDEEAEETVGMSPDELKAMWYVGDS